MSGLAPYRIPANYNTPLSTADEHGFRNWLGANRVPFNPDAKSTDYDMRGFYQALIGNNPTAQTAINSNDNRLHFPDAFKTPLHQSFSNESRYATPNAPQWISDSQLGYPNGRVVYDEKSPNQLFGMLGDGAETMGSTLGLPRNFGGLLQLLGK